MACLVDDILAQLVGLHLNSLPDGLPAFPVGYHTW
jgi:hypothetical protein